MPAILAELIEMVLAAGEEEGFLESFDAIAEKFLGNRSKLLKKAINSMSGDQEQTLRSHIGNHFTDRIQAHFNPKNKLEKNKPIGTFNVSNRSDWVKSLAWSPELQTATLVTQKSIKKYKLPFFPRQAIELIKEGANPGKTIWRKYWRVVGKGTTTNKLKNLIKVKSSSKVIRVVNKAIPSVRVPKITQNKAFNKNIIKKITLKTGNIPKTGAKGVSIKIKTPGIRKH